MSSSRQDRSRCRRRSFREYQTARRRSASSTSISRRLSRSLTLSPAVTAVHSLIRASTESEAEKGCRPWSISLNRACTVPRRSSLRRPIRLIPLESDVRRETRFVKAGWLDLTAAMLICFNSPAKPSTGWSGYWSMRRARSINFSAVWVRMPSSQRCRHSDRLPRQAGFFGVTTGSTGRPAVPNSS